MVNLQQSQDCRAPLSVSKDCKTTLMIEIDYVLFLEKDDILK